MKVKTENEMVLKANERKNKEGICRRKFPEHLISPVVTEEGGRVSHTLTGLCSVET